MPETEPSELPAEDREIKVMPPKRNPSRLASRESVKPELLLPAPAQPPLELPAIFRSMNLSRDESPAPPPPPLKDHPPKTPPNISRWQAPSSWDIPHGKNVATEISPITSSPGSSPETASHRKSHTEMMSHFQRFVRRMEGAGPRIIMERLKEEWDEPSDRSMSDELQLEKHLWALTALQLRALDRFARPSQSIAPSGPLPPFSLNRRRKILELDGNVGMFLYQLTTYYSMHALIFQQVRFTNSRQSTQIQKLHTSRAHHKVAVYRYLHKRLNTQLSQQVQQTALSAFQLAPHQDSSLFLMPTPPCTTFDLPGWRLFSRPPSFPLSSQSAIAY
jgi:hypothetical protein